MWQSVKGCVIIECKGRNLSGFLDAVRRQNIPISELAGARDRVTMTLSRSDFRLIRPIVRRHGIRVHIVGRRGIIFPILRLRFRPVLVIGLPLALAALAFLSTRFLWIEIDGTERIPDAVILRALAGQGVERFGTLPEDAFATVSAKARLYDDRIAWISLERHGSTLMVHVTEHRPTVNRVDPDAVCDIVAVKDGIITGLDVRKGNAVVSLGDAVKAGQTLVEGVYFPRTNEVVEEPLRVHASASITANVLYFVEGTAAKTAKELKQNGKTAPYRAVLLFGKRIVETKPPFMRYEVIDCADTAVNDVMLPLRVVSGRYAELSEQETVRSESEQKELASAQAEAFAELKLPRDARILDRRTEYYNSDGLMHAVVGITSEESIGMERETEP